MDGFIRPKDVLMNAIISAQKKPIEREVSDSTTLEKRSREEDDSRVMIMMMIQKLKPGQGPRPPGLDGGAGVELEDNSDFTLFDLLGGGKKKRKKRTRKRKRSRRSKKKRRGKGRNKTKKEEKEQEEEKES